MLSTTVEQQQATQVLWVRPEDVVIDSENQVRLDLFIGIEDLAHSIDVEGLKQKPQCWLDSEGHPHLKAGRRRLEAIKRLKWGKMPIEAVPGDLKSSIMDTFTENFERENYTPMEEAQLLANAIALGWSEAEISARRNKKVQWVKDRLALLEAAPKVQKRVQEGKLGVETAKAVLEAPKEIQDKLAEEIVKDRMDLRSAKEHVNESVQDYEADKEFKRLMKETKFPKCPECGAPPSEYATELPWVNCSKLSYSDKHKWNLKTGSTRADELKAERAKEQERVQRSFPDVGIKEPKEPKEPDRVIRSFRYTVPVPVLVEALRNKAIALIEKQLKKADKASTIKVTIGSFSLSFESGQTGLSFDLAGTEAFVEAKRYGDKPGNLCKVNPNHSYNAKQGSIDKKNAEIRRFLGSLPEVAAYLKKRRTQKPL